MQALGWVLAIFLGAACAAYQWYGGNEIAANRALSQQQLAQQQQVVAQREADVAAQEKLVTTLTATTADLEAKRTAAQKDKDDLGAKIEGLKTATSDAKSKATKITDLSNEIMDLKGKLSEALGK